RGAGPYGPSALRSRLTFGQAADPLRVSVPARCAGGRRFALGLGPLRFAPTALVAEVQLNR
ncbi:hypothetical protein P3T30_006273, partial [Kitasatospora sp. MAP12-9]|uniref:hypothetical protein n=1 Tax=Kitasatospora sp. MAP12-9 TaxID=3035100 RepID=UPI003D20C2ED